MTDRRRLVIDPLSAQSVEIGRALWMLEDARQRTRRFVDDLPAGLLDWQREPNGHSIGTLLYHIAAVEMDWLATEVLEGKAPESAWSQFPHDVRLADGRLTPVTGVNLRAHLQRLEFVRGLLLDTYRAMDMAEFQRVRVLDDADVTPEWVLHHLCQHEAEHRDEIIALRMGAERALNLTLNG